jgi:Protein of unknown function (DUF3151)
MLKSTGEMACAGADHSSTDIAPASAATGRHTVHRPFVSSPSQGLLGYGALLPSVTRCRYLVRDDPSRNYNPKPRPTTIRDMSELHVTESPEIRIDEPPGSLDALTAARSPAEVVEVAARYPECLTAWAALGESALDDDLEVMAYAYFRVGYHRGLDRLRGAGWRGAGRVPWAHEGNRGFLRSLEGLGAAAAAIGENVEATRCREFFRQLAPDA